MQSRVESSRGAARGAAGAASGILGKAHGVAGGRPSQEDAEVECVGCREKLPLQVFDAERMSFWRSRRNVHRDAKCKACGPELSEEIAAVECVGCRKQILGQAFDAERFNMWRRNRDITNKRNAPLVGLSCQIVSEMLRNRHGSKACTSAATARANCFHTSSTQQS